MNKIEDLKKILASNNEQTGIKELKVIAESIEKMSSICDQKDKQIEILEQQVACLQEFIYANGYEDAYEEQHGHAYDELCTCEG
jgi:hypothetical protein